MGRTVGVSALPCKVEVQAGAVDFESGLAIRLADALGRIQDGELFALSSQAAMVPALEPELETWSKLTGNAIVGRTADAASVRWVIRRGQVRSQNDGERRLGSRLWLYTNFDCNLTCDYCCVRSSPSAPRRQLGLERALRIAKEAPALGVEAFFLTGGEPFVLRDIGDIVNACASAAPTTVLTNGMLFQGARLEALRSLPRDRVTLQISLDSATPEPHDRHRGKGTWGKTREGIRIAQREGFRVRLAATVEAASDEAALHAFFNDEGVAETDHVIRQVALRGFAREGVALARADLVPEVTITAEGVYWHPVGADDEDLFVTRDIFPLAKAFDAVRRAAEREAAFATRLATIFNCA
jgi:pyruvate-formate lyase-activating enzyme